MTYNLFSYKNITMAKEILLLSLMTMAYCKDNATNETFQEYNVVGWNTWLTGFNDCKHIPNFTMASAEDIEDRKKFDIKFTSELEKYLPVWTYAFEVTIKSTGKSFRIKSNGILTHANVYRCIDEGGVFEVLSCCAALLNAQIICKRKYSYHLSIPEIHPQTLNSFANRMFTNMSRWGNITDENEFLHESANWNVRCLLLDENGTLRTDICTEHHRTLCIPDTTHAVFQYVGKSKIPRYTKPTTERITSSRFSNTESTTVTVSIGTDTIPAKPDVACTGVSMGVVIIVCISAVMLIILAVVLTILIMKKRDSASDRGVRLSICSSSTSNEDLPWREVEEEKYELDMSALGMSDQLTANNTMSDRHADSPGLPSLCNFFPLTAQLTPKLMIPQQTPQKQMLKQSPLI